jgi:uridine kinase
VKDRPYLIGIAGCSGSGKTYLAQHLLDILPAAHFSLDAYYVDLGHLSPEERTRFNFDEPSALDAGLLADQLFDLAQGRTIQRPVYDFAAYTRVPGEVHELRPQEYVIVEGLFALYWPRVRELCRTKVFVETVDPVCYIRREERDCRERGRTPESVRRQYDQTVRPMALQYVLPTRQHADLVISGEQDIAISVEQVLAHARNPLRD